MEARAIDSMVVIWGRRMRVCILHAPYLARKPLYGPGSEGMKRDVKRHAAGLSARRYGQFTSDLWAPRCHVKRRLCTTVATAVAAAVYQYI